MKTSFARALTLGTLSALLSFVTAAPARAQESEFRIGGIGTFTGAFSVIGDSQKKGAEMAAEMRGNKVLGVPIKFMWEDDETKPQVAVSKATRFAAEKAQFLFAPVSSSSTFAVMKIAEREKIPLLVTISVVDDITTKGNPYTFRTSNSNDMELKMMQKFVEANKLRKVYLLASDYKVGHDTVDAMKPALTAKGVQIVGEDFPAIGTRDFSIVANKIAQTDADGVLVAVSGNDLISFLKQGEQVQLQQKKTLFGQIVMDETLGKATGAAGLGVASAMRYHFSLDNEANKAFVAAFRKKYGEYPDQYAGEAFDGVSWFLDVIDSTKSWDKEKWLAAFRGSKRPNSIEGGKTMRTCDNQAEQPGFYGKGVKGTGDLPEVTMQIVNRFTAAELFEPCK